MNIVEHGFEIERGFISADEMESITKEVESSPLLHTKHGIRNAEKKFPTIETLVSSHKLLTKAQSVLGSTPRIVRVIFFDKTPDKNWLVTWHQDKTVSVSEKADITDWGAWSIKDGHHHVQPDMEVLNSMVTFRLHLDDANEQNGCLKIIPGSHSLGILSQDKIHEIAQKEQPFFCEVKARDLLLMKPHILHSSSKSSNPGHRRVVHVEYSNFELPYGLDWA